MVDCCWPPMLSVRVSSTLTSACVASPSSKSSETQVTSLQASGPNGSFGSTSAIVSLTATELIEGGKLQLKRNDAGVPSARDEQSRDATCAIMSVPASSESRIRETNPAEPRMSGLLLLNRMRDGAVVSVSRNPML